MSPPRSLKKMLAEEIDVSQDQVHFSDSFEEPEFEVDGEPDTEPETNQLDKTINDNDDPLPTPRLEEDILNGLTLLELLDTPKPFIESGH